MSEQHELMQFFKYEHLASHLQGISKPFAALARGILSHLPDNCEKDEAFRKLLEAKDCAVRAELYQNNKKRKGDR